LVRRPPRTPLSISAFFPCYNEEENVERMTQATLKTIRRISQDFEIIIVDDGSRDRTGEIADRLAAEHAEVRAVHNHPNLGYGGALQRGFREATKTWVFYTDGDGQFDVEEIDRLLPLLGPPGPADPQGQRVRLDIAGQPGLRVVAAGH